MIEHAAEALRELPPAAPFELMRRRRQIVVADDGGNCAERPHRALQPRDKRFKGLARRQRDVGPATEAEHPFEQEMGERVALDRDAQPAGIRKVEAARSQGTNVRSTGTNSMRQSGNILKRGNTPGQFNCR